MSTAAEFTVQASRLLDPAGKPVAPLPAFAKDAAELVSLYRSMVLTRAFDAKAIALQRTGRLGTYASSRGAYSPLPRRTGGCCR
jgi:pyruvate dehydrogenase E1 component alpha subunit